jgi:hypothetical protein
MRLQGGDLWGGEFVTANGVPEGVLRGGGSTFGLINTRNLDTLSPSVNRGSEFSKIHVQFL